MSPDARPALQAARRERGWSQSRAARELAELAATAGGPAASAVSLKSLLSRWENGHATPDPAYRGLLTRLYGRTEGELGLAPHDARPGRDGASSATRLRARLASAAAVDERLLGTWADQLEVARRLDDEVGGAGAAGLVEALVTELEQTFVHVVEPTVRARVGLLLARAALLAGWQELDRGDPERAWQRFTAARAAAGPPFPTAATAAAGRPGAEAAADHDDAAGPQAGAEEADTPDRDGAAADREDAAAEALAGQAAVLTSIGDPDVALAVLRHAGRPRTAGARAWWEAARGAAHAAQGKAVEARRRFDAAELALSGGDGPDVGVPPGPAGPAPRRRRAVGSDGGGPTPAATASPGTPPPAAPPAVGPTGAPRAVGPAGALPGAAPMDAAPGAGSTDAPPGVGPTGAPPAVGPAGARPGAGPAGAGVRSTGALPGAGPPGAPAGVRSPAARLAAVRRQRGQALAPLGDAGAVSVLEAALAAGIRSVRERAAAHAALARALSARSDPPAGPTTTDRVSGPSTGIPVGPATGPTATGPTATGPTATDDTATDDTATPGTGTLDATAHARAARALAERIGSVRTLDLLTRGRPARTGGGEP